MKFKNVLDELQKWVDQGFFNDVWYYIKDFSNFNLLFILQDLNFINFDIPVHEIDNQANHLIGTLNGEGFKDYYGHKLPIIMKDTLKGDRTKYSLKDPTYEWTLRESILNIDSYFSRKVEEVIWIIIKNRDDFDGFIESFQHEVAGNTTDEDYFLNIVSETIEDNNTKYHEFFGFDCDEYNIKIEILSNQMNDEIINEVNKIIKEADNLSLKIKSFSKHIISGLSGFEKDLFENKLTRSLVHNYHVIIEEMSNEIFQYVRPRILEVLKNHDGKEFFKDTYNYSKKELKSRNSFLNYILNSNIQIKIDSISKLLYLLNILIDEEINKRKNIINLSAQKLISSKIQIVENSEKNSIYRDIVVHTLKLLNENQIKIAIHSFREIIIFLDQFFYKLKSFE